MTIFLDTGVVVAYCNVRDVRHERATELLNEIRGGTNGVPFTSDYVFDESVTLTLSRTGQAGVAQLVGDLLLPASSEERFVNLLHIRARSLQVPGGPCANT